MFQHRHPFQIASVPGHGTPDMAIECLTGVRQPHERPGQHSKTGRTKEMAAVGPTRVIPIGCRGALLYSASFSCVVSLIHLARSVVITFRDNDQAYPVAPMLGPDSHTRAGEKPHWLTKLSALLKMVTSNSTGLHFKDQHVILALCPMACRGGSSRFKVEMKLSDEYKYGPSRLIRSWISSWHHSLSGHSFTHTFFLPLGPQSP